MKKKLTLCLLVLVVSCSSWAQEIVINNKYIDGFWEANWITHPSSPSREYGVYHFRKSLELSAKPASFVVHVSADNRYKLYVNGTEVGLGPARGDLEHWRFETYDLAPFLKTGENVIAAVVWNFGDLAPVAQITQQTAFILQGNGKDEQVINTNSSWMVLQNQAYAPEMESQRALGTYLVVGPGDIVDGTEYPWDWKTGNDDFDWLQPRLLAKGQTFGRGTDGNWRLVPRKIPLMEKYPLRLAKVRRSRGIEVPEGFLEGRVPLSIPANSKVTILLDQTHLTTAYPEFIVSEGAGAKIKVTYSEALYRGGNNQKGNRNEIEGKEMRGYADIFLPDGASKRSYQPLWNRTWRYLQLDIETATDALIFEDIKAEYTGYPFEEKASFSSDLPWLEDVWNVGWRTAQLCAGETYFDCPYYEQMQYVGDTRIQALISLYVAGDDRLMRRAINDFNESRVWNGLTQSRYPSAKLQIIPPYSLFWIAMIHDHWMHVGDEAYVRDLLPGIQSVLNWYARQLNKNGLLGDTKWWQFTDWTKEWPWDETARVGGVPATDKNGNSSVLTIQYAYALDYAADLHRQMGYETAANEYAEQKTALLDAIVRWCWDEEKEMLSDLPGEPIYSQHANIMAVLTDAIPKSQQKALMEKILADKSLIQATFYFKFYLFRALVKTGMADQYIEQIMPWKEMLELGLTTFAEKPDPTRSDCHAWSASPNYDLLATVAGIMPASPGFKTVRIAPALGSLNQVEAVMPHPNGDIRVELAKQDRSLLARIDLPDGLAGTFFWKGQERKLHAGANELVLQNQ